MHGNLGDLKFATIEDPTGATIDQEYYRYYTQADLTGGQPGYLHGMKYVFSAPSYSRLSAAINGADPSTKDDTTVSPYADNYFQSQ